MHSWPWILSVGPLLNFERKVAVSGRAFVSSWAIYAKIQLQFRSRGLWGWPTATSTQDFIDSFDDISSDTESDNTIPIFAFFSSVIFLAFPLITPISLEHYEVSQFGDNNHVGGRFRHVWMESSKISTSSQIRGLIKAMSGIRVAIDRNKDQFLVNLSIWFPEVAIQNRLSNAARFHDHCQRKLSSLFRAFHWIEPPSVAISCPPMQSPSPARALGKRSC